MNILPRPETEDPAVRCVLPGVPWVGFYRGGPDAPEDDPFPACVRALLQYTNDALGFPTRPGERGPWHDLHCYVMGTSGAAFRLGWCAPKWDWSVFDLLGASDDPVGGFTEGLASVGYASEVLLRQPFAQSLGLPQAADYSEADFRARIMESIRAGKPVFSLGLVGPPECCLITGYDEGGAVLVGRSFFTGDAQFSAGLEFEEAGDGDPDPYFRKRNWYPDTFALILLGDRIPRDTNQINRRALRRALEIMRTPVIRDHWSGQASYTQWADTLLKDDQFPADDLATLTTRHEIHHGAGGTLAEARAWGAGFLHTVAAMEPAAAHELIAAAGCFDNEHDLVWAIWEFTSGMDTTEGGARRMADSGTRGRMVPLIRMARQQDQMAAAHIERALALMGEPPLPGTPGSFGQALLAGVPRVGFDVHLSPFPGSLFSIMQYLGDPVPYDFIMGVTGAAFRRLWNRDDGGNIDLSYFAPEPIQRAAEALRYELTIIPPNKPRMLAAIHDSIASGRPVIGFGIIGPPEAGVIAGYEEGGEVLRGWSYFQDGSVPGYYSERGWFERFAQFTQAPDSGLGPVGVPPMGLVVVGDRMRWPGPSRRDLLIHTLRWAIDLERTAHREHLPNHVSGLAAYDAWAAGLEADADYPLDNPETLATRLMVHGDQCVMLEERRNAAGFLRMMAPEAPAAADQLEAAAELYDRVADLSSRIWLRGFDMGPETARALADPATREGIAAAVREASALEFEAVAALEAAVSILTAK